MATEEQKSLEGELRKREYGLIFKAILEGNHTPTQIHSYCKDKYHQYLEKDCPSYDEITHKLTKLLVNYKFLLSSKEGKITDYDIDSLELVFRVIKMIDKLVTYPSYKGLVAFLESQNLPYDPDFIAVQDRLIAFMDKIYIKENKVIAIEPMLKLFIKEIAENFVPELVGKANYYTANASLAECDSKILETNIMDDAKKINEYKGDTKKLLEIASEIHNQSISLEQLKLAASLWCFYQFCVLAMQRKILS